MNRFTKTMVVASLFLGLSVVGWSFGLPNRGCCPATSCCVPNAGCCPDGPCCPDGACVVVGGGCR